MVTPWLSCSAHGTFGWARALCRSPRTPAMTAAALTLNDLTGGRLFSVLAPVGPRLWKASRRAFNQP